MTNDLRDSLKASQDMGLGVVEALVEWIKLLEAPEAANRERFRQFFANLLAAQAVPRRPAPDDYTPGFYGEREMGRWPVQPARSLCAGCEKRPESEPGYIWMRTDTEPCEYTCPTCGAHWDKVADIPC